VLALVAAATCLVPVTPAHADALRDSQWYLRYLKVAQAQQISQGEGVTVAVLDTGVSPHPDLDGNLLPGGDVTVNGTNGQEDLVGHGTAMAGLIAAHGRGANGILGMAPKAKILPVLNGVEIENLSQYVPGGFQWAVQHGAKVICAAFGTRDSPALHREIQAALDADVVVVAAAGNHPDDQTVTYPGAYPGVLTAAGVDSNGNHADVSVAGPQVVLSAPAVEVISTGLRSGTFRGTGTSSATAILAGAAALVRAKYPRLSAAEVVHRLTATADDKGAPGRDPEYGYGVVNLVAALTADVPPLPASGSASASPGVTGSTSSAATKRAAPETKTNPALFIAIGLGLLLVAAAGAATYLIRRART
jgi:type VII secretion-associated serine protease mycosin